MDGEAAYTVKVNRRSLLGVMLSHLAAPEGRTRMLCVAFLCLQYSVYALLRRYATGILREDWSMEGLRRDSRHLLVRVARNDDDHRSDDDRRRHGSAKEHVARGGRQHN